MAGRVYMVLEKATTDLDKLIRHPCVVCLRIPCVQYCQPRVTLILQQNNIFVGLPNQDNSSNDSDCGGSLPRDVVHASGVARV